MRTKKLIASVLAVTLALGTLSVLPKVTDTENGIAITAEAASSDFVIKKDQDGDKYIAGYKGKGGDITIPKNVYVGDDAFNGNMDITSITFPADGYSYYVGKNAFANCANLEKIVFKGDAYFGISAFANCVNLRTVEIKGTCLGISTYAFKQCELLEKFSIKKQVKGKDNTEVGIGYYAFYNCFSLSSFVVPKNFETIYPKAFLNCVSLKNLKIPSGTKMYEDKKGKNYHFGYFEKASSELDLKSSIVMNGYATEDAFTYTLANGKKSSYFMYINKGGEAFTSGEFMDIIGYPDFKELTPVKLTVTVKKGSDAEKYCKKNKIAYKYAK